MEVYIQDSRYYITRSAAYSLGFTSVRAIMLQDSENLYEILPEQFENLKHSDLELKIIHREQVPKQKIQVFISEDKMYILTATAYSIGLLDDKTFYETSKQLYEINESIFVFINDKYDIKYENLQKQDHSLK